MTFVAGSEQTLYAGFDESVNFNDAIAAFSEVTVALNTEMELESLLHLVCEKLCDLLGIARGSLFLKDEKTGCFHGRVAHGGAGIDAHIRRYVAGAPADGLTNEILTHKQPVLVAKAQRDPRPTRAVMRRWDIRTILGVPMIQDEEVIGLFFVDNCDRPYPYTQSQQLLAQVFANLAASAVSQAAGRLRLREKVDSLERQKEALKHVSVVNDELIKLLLGGAGVAEIATGISELTGNPCVIHDASYRRIAEASSEGTRPSSILDETVRSHPAVAPQLAAITGRRAAILGPVIQARLGHRFLIAPVTAHSDLGGYLVIEERNTKFGKVHEIVAQRAASIIGLELRAARRGLEVTFNSRQALVDELIRSDSDDASVESRAKQLKVDLRRPHLLAVARGRNSQTDDAMPTPREFLEALSGEQADPAILAADIGAGVALVLPLDMTAGSREAVAAIHELLDRRLERLGLGNRELLLGISSACLKPGDYPRAYQEAAQIVDLLEEHAVERGPGQFLAIASDEIGVGRLLLATHSPRQLDEFLVDTLGPEIDLTDSRTATMLATVDCYFRFCRSIVRVAEMLGIHQNSVRYRLSRFVEMTGLDLDADGDALLEVQLALLAMRLRGALNGGRDLHPEPRATADSR